MKIFLYLSLFFITLSSIAQVPICGYSKQQLTATSFANPSDVVKMDNYDVTFYKLDVAVENNSTYISGNVTIVAKVIHSFSEFVFELHDSLFIDSVLINNAKKSYTRNNGVVTVSINGNILANTSVRAVVYYKGNTPQDLASANGNGFSNSKALNVTWSLSESFVAYEWWPCKQVLYDKADSAEIWITTDSANKAGSNGLLMRVTNLPNSKKRYEWKTHYPIDYYLLSVTVAKYVEYDLYAHPVGISDSVLIQNYIYDTSVIHALNFTPSLIEMFSQAFGVYPFALEKYGHCMAPINGGMEHQTMTTLGPSNAYTFDIIAHELAHQWFGDLVTCGSWADIWLNEGFASYCEYVANERLATGNAATWMTNAMIGASNAWGWVYVNDTLNTATLFNSNASYKKGAAILHMLRYEINNDSIFFQGIRNYLNAHQYATAVSKDFQNTMEQTSGKNFGYFFDQWLHGLGYPIFSGRWNQINDQVYVLLNQTTSNIATTLFKTSLDIKFNYNGGDTTIRIWVDSNSKVYSFLLPGVTVNNIVLDPKDRILNGTNSFSHDPLYNSIQNVSSNYASIFVYPNPTENLLNILNGNGCFVEIFDISGKVLLTQKMDDTHSSIDITELTNGFYFIRLDRSGAISNLKFVKEIK